MYRYNSVTVIQTLLGKVPHGNSLPNNFNITGVYILLGKYFTYYYTGTEGPLQDNLRIILWKLKKPLGIFRRVLSIVQYMSYKERMKGPRSGPVIVIRSIL